jgi:triacylglycerol lipase
MKLIAKAAAPGGPPELFSAAPELQVHDTLAAGNRLWVRGRLSMPPSPSVDAVRRPWWRWRRVPPQAAACPCVTIQTQVGGETLMATVPVRPDGNFDASFEAALPPARRGWRIARNQLTWEGKLLRACSVVLELPEEAKAATVVILPLAYTHEPGGVQRLARWLLARPLAELFQRRQQGVAAPCPVYFVGAVPPDGPNLHPELALVATSLGWPSGSFILLPAAAANAPEAIAAAVDRMRWLLAGRLDLLVVNQEPQAEAALAGVTRVLPDRAAVERLVRADETLGDICPRPVSETPHLLPHAVRPTRSRSVPRHPLVFCHGMLAMTMLRMQIPKDSNYFVHLRPFLSERGVHALFPNVEPTGGVIARAEQLRDHIRRWTDEPVNLIAHSMGGLDARFAITRLGLANRVRSLTTIATPHRGSALADWFCANFGQRVPLLLTLEAFGVNVDGFADCKPSRCHVFNEQTPDDPGVRYFSYTAAVTPPRITPALRRAWSIMTPLEGPNDGIVSVTSARWGEVVGSLAVDHFAQTPDALFVRPDENFDSLGFYSRLIEDLARRGF